MSIFDAIILGIVQGLTEFLPVSSSGHLELAKAMLGSVPDAEQSMIITVVLHVATVLSTIVIYRKDIAAIFSGLFKGQKEEVQFSIKIVLSMIPAAIVGVAFNDQIESLFSGQILLVGIMLLLTGVLLFAADKAKNTEKEVSILHSIIIGVSQAIAILPGISRSGATISISVLLGIDKAKSAKFSFLMVIPLILGKMAKDILDEKSGLVNIEIAPIVVGFITAFITGLIACTWMINLVRNGKLTPFAIYCFSVGTIAIIYSLV